MINLFCVRAEFGTYTKHFVEGGYVAIGWMSHTDLSAVKSRDELYPRYKQAHPDDTSNIVIGQQVAQIARFLLEIAAGDYVLTPAADTEWLHHGEVAPDPSYVYVAGDDGCPYRHRRRVVWAKERRKRGNFSVPFQNAIRSSLTVFAVSQRDELVAVFSCADLAPKPVAAIGFEGSEVTGRAGACGVDSAGEFNLAGTCFAPDVTALSTLISGERRGRGALRKPRHAGAARRMQ